MIKTILATMALALLTASAFAQTVTPKNEISLDAIFVRDALSVTPKISSSTDQLGASFNIAHYFGKKTGVGLDFEVADSASGRSATSANLATVTAGLMFKARTKRIAPFLKLNGGIARLSARNDLFKFNTSNSGLVVVAGGGLDVKVKSFFIRFPEIDYLATRMSGKTVNHIRVGVGLGVSF
jgi:hypothetical protein